MSEFSNKNTNLLHGYNNITDVQKEKQIIENAPEGNSIGKCHYLEQWWSVIRPEKLTTKMRIVFNARAKSGDEKSLNGPSWRQNCLAFYWGLELTVAHDI